MKQFNLQSFETHPDGSVILFTNDDRQMRITRGAKGTRVETANAHTATYFWRDEAFADASAVHVADVADIPFAAPGKYPGDIEILI